MNSAYQNGKRTLLPSVIPGLLLAVTLLTQFSLFAGASLCAGDSPAWIKPPKAPVALADIPSSGLSRSLQGLSAEAQARALERLKDMPLNHVSIQYMFASADGAAIGIACFHDAPKVPGAVPIPAWPSRSPNTGASISPSAQSTPMVSAAAVPIANPPIYHSKLGAPYVIYLDFNGHVVKNTAWNVGPGAASSYDSKPFDRDGDLTMFSDAEQNDILHIWQRVKEDFAPFNVDVTTQEPSVWNANTCRALITQSKDRAGVEMPAFGAGGVAYVGAFGSFSYDADKNTTYGPAFIYADALGPNNEGFIAEATAHEVGHNLGLSHDGVKATPTSPTQGYYGGHNGSTSATSWGPIMGTGYNQNVSQWSKGEYINANNTEDDLAIIAAVIPYRTDDHGNTNAAATALTASAGTTLTSSGIIERNTDVDVVSFVSTAGSLALTVAPWLSPVNTRGGNLDVKLILYNAANEQVATAAPTGQTSAIITASVPAGTYYLHIRNDGEPTPPNTGYTPYGSIGQWFLNGTITAEANGPDILAPTASLDAPIFSGRDATAQDVVVTFSDNVAITTATIDNSDITVTKGAFSTTLTRVTAPGANGTPKVITYRFTPPGGTWDATDNGIYTFAVVANQVADTAGNTVAAGTLGTLHVAIPVITISREPASQTVFAPSSANFSVAASCSNGGVLSYQWQRSTDSGATFPNLSGSITPAYNTGATTLNMNGYRYRVVVSSPGASSVTSNAAILTVETSQILGMTYVLRGTVPNGASVEATINGAPVSITRNGSAWTAQLPRGTPSVQITFRAPDNTTKSRVFVLSESP